MKLKAKWVRMTKKKMKQNNETVSEPVSGVKLPYLHFVLHSF